MLLKMENVSRSFGTRVIFKNADLTVYKGDRIGLIGPNGMGKSTFLNVMCGELEADSGKITPTYGTKIGYLHQHSGLSGNKTVLQELTDVFSDLAETEKRMRLLEEMISVAGALPSLSEEYESLNKKFIAADGYSINVKIATVMSGMGFTGRDNDIVSKLSGGEKTRLALAKLLLEAPDILVLDEPTNHLDFSTISWLEDYLLQYNGAILVVSHDRYFLDKLTDKIWELEDTEISVFKGNYSKYKILKAEQLKTRLREYEKQQNTIASMEDYVRRNIVRASTSNMAKSRLHQLEHIERLEKPKVHTPTPHFSFNYTVEPVKDVLSVSKLTLTVGEEKRVLGENLEFSVRRGDRIALIGGNGTGKTTLMRTLLSINPHSVGSIDWGRNVKTNYFEQENDAFIPTNSVLDELWRHFPQATPLEMRKLLGAMLFSGDDVYKSVSVLSGGERARLKFAIMAAGDANFLLFDEPTNHLDLPAREALEAALKEYTGTIIFVSHDRYFINTVADRILELEDGKLTEYNGNFDEYQNQKKATQSVIAEKPAAATEKNRSNAYHRTKAERSEEAKRKRRIGELERLIAEAEERIAALTEELQTIEVASDYQLSMQKCEELEDANASHDRYMEEWLELSE